MKNRLSSSHQSKSFKTEVKYDVSCYGYTSMREEYSILKVCEKRVGKYEEAAGDCKEESYMMCMFFNMLLSWSSKGE